MYFCSKQNAPSTVNGTNGNSTTTPSTPTTPAPGTSTTPAPSTSTVEVKVEDEKPTPDFLDSISKAEEKSKIGFPTSQMSNLNVGDYRTLVKTLVCGVKTITWGCASCKVSYCFYYNNCEFYYNNVKFWKKQREFFPSAFV